LTIGPAAIVWFAALVTRHRLSVFTVVTVALLVLLVTNAIVANVLTSAQTV
jgi:hypothetical protein